MEGPLSRVTKPGSFAIRRARFDDVPPILRLIQRAVEEGCRRHYDPVQRRAVYVSYGRRLFAEAVERFELIAAELDGRLVGAAQLDPATGGLRALFVDAAYHGGGVGGTLLAEVESRAAHHGLRALHGLMSLNAAAFYARAGFRPCDGPHQLGGAIFVPVIPMAKTLPAAAPRR